eukprot:COSAG04_NODE_11983_length_677_cov_1.058824_2_plen_41_part_01
MASSAIMASERRPLSSVRGAAQSLWSLLRGGFLQTSGAAQ